MRHSVGVCRDEHATRVLADAKRRVLDLVVVDVAIKTNDNRPDILVVVHQLTTRQRDLLASVRFTTNVLDADAVEFLQDARLSDDIRLLLEIDRFQIRRRGEGRRKDFLGVHFQSQRLELLRVPGSRLGGVVRHEDQSLAH